MANGRKLQEILRQSSPLPRMPANGKRVPVGTGSCTNWNISRTDRNGDFHREQRGIRFDTLAPASYKNERGMTYLAALLAVVLMGISVSVVGKSWSVTMQREREAELLFRGLRIKDAIERYAADYEVRKGTRENQYPLTLDQLIEGPKRYLPVMYTDPVTGEAFDLIRVDDQIRGVKSRSQQRPWNRVQMKEADRYDQVEFRARPPSPTGSACSPGVDTVNPLNPFGTGPCPAITPPASP